MTEAFKLIDATEDHCRFLWELANEPEVRSASFHSETIPWETHVQWFNSRLQSKNCCIYVAYSSRGEPIGQVRFEEGTCVQLSVSLTGSVRGQGLGPRLIREAVHRYHGSHCDKTVWAFVRPENTSSIKAFTRAGFQQDGTKKINNINALCFILGPSQTQTI